MSIPKRSSVSQKSKKSKSFVILISLFLGCLVIVPVLLLFSAFSQKFKELSGYHPRETLLAAESMLDSDDIQGARNALQRVLANEPRNATALSLLASTYTKSGDNAKAYELLRTAWMARPNDTKLQTAMADAYQRAMEDDASPATLTVEEKLLVTCGQCHKHSSPDVLPKRVWESTIPRMFQAAKDRHKDMWNLTEKEALDWYVEHAPEKVALGHLKAEPVEPGAFQRRDYALPAGYEPPAISNVRFLDVDGDSRPEIVACDMRNGKVYLIHPNDPEGDITELADIPFPSHANIVDLDQDGLLDMLVTNLGSFGPMDQNDGSLVWLWRLTEDADFVACDLMDNIGRLTDAQPADFDGDGDLDIVVAEFGSYETGGIYLLENETEHWLQPVFTRHEIEDWGGAIHVPVIDLNGDGLPDFVTVIAQEHESVVAYINKGDLTFEKVFLYEAPSPAWGYTGLSLVDFNQDGRQDIVCTNGDGFDAGGLLRSYHGIQWFENMGGTHFEPRAKLPLPGAHQAKAVDIDNDGDMDLVGSAFQPFVDAEDCKRLNLPALVIFEQWEKGRVTCKSLLPGSKLLYPTVDAADFDGDGDIDIVTGVFEMGAPGGSAFGRDQNFWQDKKAAKESGPAIVLLVNSQ